MTAPERGTANRHPVLAYRPEFPPARKLAVRGVPPLDPESVAIDPLAHL
jgi:hypothetical protein